MARARPGSRAALHLAEYFGRSGAGSIPERLNLATLGFTPYMCKRPGQAAFDYAPIVQGDLDVAGTGDVIAFQRGTLLGNQAQYFYERFDPYQGTFSFWVTPEWDGNDGRLHSLVFSQYCYIQKTAAGGLLALNIRDGSSTWRTMSVDVSAWTAGTTYHVVASWDTRNTLDGSNYARISVNNSHTYGITTISGASEPPAPFYVGYTVNQSANAIIEGFCVSRIPWLDSGGYGCPMWFDESGPIDVITAVYAAGAGADPAQIFGSWDCTFFLPTDQTAGALGTTGEAWGHPFTSELIDVPFVDDGGLPGTDQSIVCDGANTLITVSDNVTIQDLPDAEITFAAWVKANSSGETAGRIASKGVNGSTGFQIYLQAEQIIVYIYCATTNSVAVTSVGGFPEDGKYHYFAFHFNDAGTRRARISVDGVWSALGTIGVGAYQSEVGDDLIIGNLTGAGRTWDGDFAWVEISDNDRHGGAAGTDFVPPRTPYNDGNTVECWLFDEGTGATAAAQVNTPANDGTITSGSWSAIWEIVGTPEIPQSLQFFQENDGIDFGSGANIDDLPSGDCTLELWARIPLHSQSSDMRVDLLSKGSSGLNDGWSIYIANGFPYLLSVRINFATTDVFVTYSGINDDCWHHIAVDFDVGTLTARLFVDGVLIGSGTSGSGAYQADAASDCLSNAVASIGSYDGSFAIGWIRLSDTRRYTGNSFIPNARNNPPGNDANAQLLINMDDGAGTTATDSSGNGYDGTITFGVTTRWNNTPDLAIEEPGRMIYQQGYNVGSDGANDGIYIPFTLTADTDYVVRAVLQYSPNAWPRITLYDVTAAGAIVDFDAPPMTAVHDGGAAAAAFTSTGEVYPASLIGGTIYNVDDGSSGTITAVGGTNQDTITATLAGGGSNDWGVGEQAYIVPPDNWVFNEPICVHTSANTAYELRITNRNSDGIITIHQAELLENLALNGDHEDLDGGAPGAAELITGWTNPNLDAGDTEPEAAIIHAGAQSLEWNTSASDEGMYYAGNIAVVGSFYAISAWTRGDGTVGFLIGCRGNGWGRRHSDATADAILSSVAACWTHTCAVYQAQLADISPMLYASSGAVGDRFTDDIYAIELDPVTLTVTPASQANSLEGAGIRVDGIDQCLDAPTTLTALTGWVREFVVVRQTLATCLEFHTEHNVFLARFDINNFFHVRLRPDLGATHLELRCVAGGVAATANAALPGGDTWNAGETKMVDVRYTFPNMSLWVDGAYVTGVVMPNPLAGTPTQIWWGMGFGDYVLDGVVY